MQSQAIDVTTYPAVALDERCAVPGEVRRHCRNQLDGYAEIMQYAMPGCTSAGVINGILRATHESPAPVC